MRDAREGRPTPPGRCCCCDDGPRRRLSDEDQFLRVGELAGLQSVDVGAATVPTHVYGRAIGASVLTSIDCRQDPLAQHVEHIQPDKEIALIARLPPCLDEGREIGIDARAWIGEPVADRFVLSSASYCPARIDIADAVHCASDSGVPIYAGFDGMTHITSPHEGYDRGVPAVLRAVALNGYEQGAAGVYIFNYDYRNHRAGPRDDETYNDDHLQLLTDLADPGRLARRDRCYCVPDSHLGVEPVYAYASGDHRPQVPRELSVLERSTGGPGYEMRLLIEDDIDAGLADGRIAGTQLRLRLTGHETHLDRIICRVNDRQVALDGAGSVANQWGQSWLVVEDPPIRRGENTVLLGLRGLQTPDPWPAVHQCEVMVLGQ